MIMRLRIFILGLLFYSGFILAADQYDVLIKPSGLEQGKKVPLVIFMHGAGSCPQYLEPYFKELADAWKYIMYLPAGMHEAREGEDGRQIFNWDFMETGQVLKRIKKVIRNNQVDPGLVFLCGFSAGGTMTYLTVMDDPETFAGAVILGSRLPEKRVDQEKMKKASGKVPIFITHGKDDTVVSFAGARKAEALLKKNGYKVKFKSGDYGHEIPPEWMDILKEGFEFSCNGSDAGNKSQAQAGGDWKDLFSGKNFEGFEFFFGEGKTENKDTFSIKDGVMIITGRPSGYIYTKKSYSRYTLKYDWKFKRPDNLEDDNKFRANSGCLIHIAGYPGIRVWPRCIEVQGMWHQAGLILPIPRNLKCKKTDDKKAREAATRPVGEWNTNVIEVDGGDMTITINGRKISTVSDCELTEGPVGFQSEGKEIHLRNIQIKEK